MTARQTVGLEGDPIGPPQTDEERVEHTVWDEPGLSATLAGSTPDHAITYPAWLAAGERAITPQRSQWICLWVILCAGPFSILGTFAHQFFAGQHWGAIALCVVGPMVEEMMKIAAILWIVEKRPFYFKSTRQIVLCAAASGLWFAVIENVLYLNVYIPDPSPSIIAWRWTACVLLHVGCTVISSIGLSRIWKMTMATRTRPQLALGANFIIAAVVVHGIYNAGALVAGMLSQF